MKGCQCGRFHGKGKSAICGRCASALAALAQLKTSSFKGKKALSQDFTKILGGEFAKSIGQALLGKKASNQAKKAAEGFEKWARGLR